MSQPAFDFGDDDADERPDEITWSVRELADAINGTFGSFDVSSDEYWQVIAGISYPLTENTSLALAYRMLSVDYQQGGFLYDTKTSGPNVGLVFRF